MLNYQKIGTYLKHKRKEHHYSQSDLAQILFVSRQVISNWERGKSLPNYELLFCLSSLYHVSILEILQLES